MEIPKLCDGRCNECPIIRHPNSRMLTAVLNEAHGKFGSAFYTIVQARCPNLTCCYDCGIDDFCHVEGCWTEQRGGRDHPRPESAPGNYLCRKVRKD